MRYNLVCTKCEHAFEHIQPMKDPMLRKCPKCRALALEQDFSQKNVIVNDGVPRTVGQQAEYNAKKAGKQVHEALAEQMLSEQTKKKKNTPTPWFREKGSKPLDVSKIKDTTKFIMTGEKD